MQKRFLPIALALAVGAPALLSAGTYYVPNPVYGGGQPSTELEIKQTTGGPRTLAPIFVRTDQPGTGLTAAAVDVNNNRKPNVFSVGSFITGSGMLKLVGDAGISVQTASVFLEGGGGSWAWGLPVISSANWFTAGKTAYIQGLARNTSGASNLEIMSFGEVQASCRYQLRKADGSAIGTAKAVAIKPLSSQIATNPLLGIAPAGDLAGIRAEVQCDQPFYAYGTFAAKNPKNFRMLYPFDTPPAAYTEVVNLSLPGVFFRPVQGASIYYANLPLVPGKAYRKATIDFDFHISEFSSIYTGLVGMFHTGGPRFNKTLYFGSFVRGARGRSLIDQGSPVVEPALKFSTRWQTETDYHATITYDAENAMLRYQVFHGTETVMDVTGGAYSLDLADRGQPVKLSFGLAGVADSAYFPPWGWTFSNLRAKVER